MLHINFKLIFLFLSVLALTACNNAKENTKTVSPTTKITKSKPALDSKNPKGKTAKLIRLNEKSKIAIGQVNGIPMNKLPNVIPLKSDIIISGWAYDSKSNLPCSAVEIVIGDNEYPTKYKIPRQGVGKLLNNEKLIPTGFSATIPYEKIPKGVGSIKFKLTTTDGKSYYNPEVNLKLKYTKN